MSSFNIIRNAAVLGAQAAKGDSGGVGQKGKAIKEAKIGQIWHSPSPFITLILQFFTP
jgi:hypothetical protein